MKYKNASVTVFFVMISIFSASNIVADTDTEKLREQVQNLQLQIDVLKDQLDSVLVQESHNTANQVLVTDTTTALPDTLIHVTGYADVGYTDTDSGSGSFGVGTFAPIFHFQYRDEVMLEAELEFEVEEDGATKTSLEYLTIDYFLNDYLTVVGGKFLSPIGQFRQNLHPSWINKLPSAPPGFGHDGAAPVSDMGFQIRGGFPISGARTNYALYVSNGPELKAEMEEEDGEIEFELDGVEAEGFGSDVDGEKTYGGRFGVLPIPGLEFGVSSATGKATVTTIEGGDSSILSNEGVRDYDVIGVDFNWQINSFGLRGEFVKTKVGADANGTAASEGATWTTWYTQGVYRLPKTDWELVTRYADFDSPHSSQDQTQWALGVNYLFTNNFIAKFSYEFNDGILQSKADDNRLLMQLAYGF